MLCVVIYMWCLCLWPTVSEIYTWSYFLENECECLICLYSFSKQFSHRLLTSWYQSCLFDSNISQGNSMDILIYQKICCEAGKYISSSGPDYSWVNRWNWVSKSQIKGLNLWCRAEQMYKSLYHGSLGCPVRLPHSPYTELPKGNVCSQGTEQR